VLSDAHGTIHAASGHQPRQLLSDRCRDQRESLIEAPGVGAAEVQSQEVAGRFGWEPLGSRRDDHTKLFALDHEPRQGRAREGLQGRTDACRDALQGGQPSLALTASVGNVAERKSLTGGKYLRGPSACGPGFVRRPRWLRRDGLLESEAPRRSCR
jgi:hypothetical protein